MSTHEHPQPPLLQAIDLKNINPVKKGNVRAGTSGEGAGWRFV
mgnify:CR=1 FL=1